MYETFAYNKYRGPTRIADDTTQQLGIAQMKMLKTTLFASMLALAFIQPALANNTGLPVVGTLAFGTNGANGGQHWSPQSTVIGSGLEYRYIDGSNTDTADFTATQLIINDVVNDSANGWEMTFATTGGFKSFSLASSNFDPGLTYSLTSGKLVIDWVGVGTGPENYTATFNVNAVTAVPEPETYALMLGGLGLLGFMARRRKG